MKMQWAGSVFAGDELITSFYWAHLFLSLKLQARPKFKRFLQNNVQTKLDSFVQLEVRWRLVETLGCCYSVMLIH